MIDMKKMTGATMYGEDQIIIIMQGEYWGPYTMDEAAAISKALRRKKK
jgi:hypothetical protein